jgi:hypothetical protein
MSLILVFFYRCEPTMPDYEVEKSKNMLVVSSVLSSGNSNQILHISKTNLFESLPQQDLDKDSIKVIIKINSYEYMLQPDSIIKYWGRFYYYFKCPLKPYDQVSVKISHPDYESVQAEVEIPDSVFCKNPMEDTLLYELPEKFKFYWNEEKSAEAYFVKIFLSASNHDSNDFEIQLNSQYHENLLQSANIQTICNYTLTNDDFKNCIKNSVQEKNYFRSWNENEINLKLFEYETVYLYAKIYSLDENAIYCFEQSNSQDELSGFNTKIELYSNVENGRGLVCAYSTAKSKKIYFDKKLIEECLNGE